MRNAKATFSLASALAIMTALAVHGRDLFVDPRIGDDSANGLAAKAADELLRLFSEGVVPQSSLALESSMSAYQVGTVDFLSVIGNFSTVLNYEIDYYRELANYQSSLARMESMVGVDLTSTVAQPNNQHTPGGE